MANPFVTGFVLSRQGSALTVPLHDICRQLQDARPASAMIAVTEEGYPDVMYADLLALGRPPPPQGTVAVMSGAPVVLQNGRYQLTLTAPLAYAAMVNRNVLVQLTVNGLMTQMWLTRALAFERGSLSAGCSLVCARPVSGVGTVNSVGTVGSVSTVSTVGTVSRVGSSDGLVGNAGPKPLTRYLRVHLRSSNATDYLNLAGLEAYDAYGNRLRSSAPVPCYAGNLYGNEFPCKNLDDDNRGTFYHSLNDTNAWVEMDLGAGVPCAEVRVYNRQDCCQERLTKFQLSVLSPSRVPVLMAPLTNALEQKFRIPGA